MFSKGQPTSMPYLYFRNSTRRAMYPWRQGLGKKKNKRVRLWGNTNVSVCCHVPVDTMAMDKMALASNVKAPPPLPNTK